MDMEPKESLVSLGLEVDRASIIGGEQNIIEIYGQGSGRGLELRNVNLPIGWQKVEIVAKKEDLDRYQSYCRSVCSKWGYDIQLINLDPTGVIKEIIIKNKKTDNESKLFLSDDWEYHHKGIYKAENVDTIETTIIFQDLMSRYLRLRFGVWNDFSYGSIFSDPTKPINGFGASKLAIPDSIFYRDDALINRSEAQTITGNSHNIAGRFGQEICSLRFNERGALYEVGLEKENGIIGGGVYLLPDEGGSVGKYESESVDNPYSAAALHGIVAMYINYLLKRKRNENKLR